MKDHEVTIDGNTYIRKTTPNVILSDDNIALPKTLDLTTIYAQNVKIMRELKKLEPEKSVIIGPSLQDHISALSRNQREGFKSLTSHYSLTKILLVILIITTLSATLMTR